MTPRPVLFPCAVLLLLAASCGSAPKKKSAWKEFVEAERAAKGEKGAQPEPAAKPVRTKVMDSDSSNAFGMQTIHFPPVSLVVEPSERDKLVKNAEVLKAHPTVVVEIEGHTDGRGKMDQSLELGEARAKVVREVMIGLGVQASRMSTISYGKDHMIDHSGTEEGYAKNRRVNFLILRQ